MHNDKSIMALVPARGGSKRLPNKNILDFNGCPLIARSIYAAQKSKYIDSIVVSTDDLAIAKIASECGADVPFSRPEQLATDSSTSNDVILHMLASVDQKPDILMLLQPTSPLRRTIDIDKCIELLFEKSADGIVSVTECEHPPIWTNFLPDDGCMENFVRQEQLKASQKFPTYYRLNGAIYCFKSDYLLKNKGIHYGKKVYAYLMEREHSVDIDVQHDFDYALYLDRKTCGSKT
ncbi:acylneuraminate cytidylyltransferase family protein [Bowmanella sp. Y26]|uniref:acylneuraminate cytidylyltransferase family protein n=1 Tax=Bowmanella yangjiangensis TaxID=2811230 RepID=UPI001BDDB008|nr:acylneuraminate cytidylyltransferase family protein [Bowmanella yangjiangensis]MBT1062889.1 acylneuraminate cytidylyltransferase family protein [Bowmanella yangjiangensis]